jgi:hypothetical protein
MGEPPLLFEEVDRTLVRSLLMLLGTAGNRDMVDAMGQISEPPYPMFHRDFEKSFLSDRFV